MSQFADIQISAARLKMLELLRECKGYSLNDQVLTSGLASMGLRFTYDQVRAELDWLNSVRAITLFPVGMLVVAELTQRGHDVAKGLLEIRGIDRPIPGSGL
jgi:hypothetical protein